MGLIERIRSWLSGVFGGSETAETPEESDEAVDDAEPSLDPSATTETRSGSTDDAVDTLREVRRTAADEATGGNGQSVESDTEADSDALERS